MKELELKNWLESFPNQESYSKVRCSTVGYPCIRKLWFIHREVLLSKFKLSSLYAPVGQQLETIILNKLAEKYKVEYPSYSLSFNWEIEGFKFWGKIDGILENTYILEIKTMGTEKVKELTNTGLKNSTDPFIKGYWWQIQMYLNSPLAEKRKIKKGLLICVGRDKLNIYTEIIEKDNNFINELTDKLRDIKSPLKPPKLNGPEKSYYCKCCEFNSLCNFSSNFPKEKIAPRVKNSIYFKGSNLAEAEEKMMMNGYQLNPNILN